MKECPKCAALTELAGGWPVYCDQHEPRPAEQLKALRARQLRTRPLGDDGNPRRRPGKTARDRLRHPPQERERKRAERAARDRERALRRGSGQKKAAR
jgi:hypothetical protein